MDGETESGVLLCGGCLLTSLSRMERCDTLVEGEGGTVVGRCGESHTPSELVLVMLLDGGCSSWGMGSGLIVFHKKK